MCPSKRSSFAHASSRIESRTFTRRFGVVDDRGQLACERAVAVLVRVVEEVVLELVEDDEQRPHALGPRAQRLGTSGSPGCQASEVAAAERLDCRSADRLHQLRQRVVAPGARTRRPRTAPAPGARWRARDLRAQVVDDAGLEQRGLADAARAVQDRQPRCAEVPGDDPLRLVAAEEEVGVVLAVRDEPDVGRRGRRRRVGCGSPDPSVVAARAIELVLEPSTYSSSARRAARRCRGRARAPPRSRARPRRTARAAPPTTSRSSCCAPQIRLRITRRFQSRIE